MTFQRTKSNNKFNIAKCFYKFSALITCFTAMIVAANAMYGDDPIPGKEIRRLAKEQHVDAIKFYREFLSLPNDAAYPNDILNLVRWLEPHLVARGFKSKRLETAGNPVLFAERKYPGAKRTALIYLQADGQPVDPSRWNQPDPYMAVLKEQSATGIWEPIDWPQDDEYNPDWRIFARSAADSKGPVAQFFSAIDAIDNAEISPDIDLKVVIDTEEEKGSPHLLKVLQENAALMQADFMLVFDGPPHTSNEPTLVFGARGLTTITLTAYGPDKPQHSGHYGNFIPNPASHLTHILGSTKDIKGRVRIDEFYSDVKFDKVAKAQMEAVPKNETEILAAMKLAAPDRVGKTLQEAIQYPSFNIRGLSSGWVGGEARTIIPETATAEIDIRTTPETDPLQLVSLVREHIQDLGYYVTQGAPTIEERLTHPHIVSMTHNISYSAFRTDFDSPAGQVARAGIYRLYSKDPVLIRMLGGSSPISIFHAVLQVPIVLVPTVNIDNNQHAPDENLRIGSFFEGIAIILSILTHDIKE